MKSKMKSKSTTPTRSYGGVSADNRETQRRDQLVEAGVRGFGKTGVARTTVGSFCTEARVSTRDFYRFFGSKEDLLLEVYDRVIDDAMLAVTTALAEHELEHRDDIAGAMHAGLGAFAESMTADEDRARINFIVVVGVSARVELRRREAIHGFAQLIEAFIGILDQRGLVKHEIISPVLYVALVGAIHETLTDWVIRSERPPLDGVVADLANLFRVTLAA